MAKNLIKAMKEAIAKSGTSKRDILYFPADSQHRIRFLQELDSGLTVEFHNDFNAQIFEPCRDPENHEDCKLCEEQIPIQEHYVWSVWDYDSNSVKLLLFKASGVSPIPSLIEMFEEFGTIMDRDYKLKKVGKGAGSSFVVTPLDKSRFRSKAKAYSNKELLDKIYEAYPTTSGDEDEDEVDEDEAKEKKSKNKKSKKEPTLREKYEELDMEDLKSICLELGMSKKEFKAFEDEEEVLDELFDNYEESDLEEVLENLEDEDDD